MIDPRSHRRSPHPTRHRGRGRIFWLDALKHFASPRTLGSGLGDHGPIALFLRRTNDGLAPALPTPGLDDKRRTMSGEAPSRPRARPVRGFPDRRAEAIAPSGAIVEAVSRVYKSYGFEPLETGAFEYADALGKFLPDAERPNAGVFALQDDDEQWMALRYDLTAPLARYVAQNQASLPRPFRRYAVGAVWRDEKPGPGRYRQFVQCDADTVGSARPEADAEMVAMAIEAYGAAGLPPAAYESRSTTASSSTACSAAAGVRSRPEAGGAAGGGQARPSGAGRSDRRSGRGPPGRVGRIYARRLAGRAPPMRCWPFCRRERRPAPPTLDRIAEVIGGSSKATRV